MGRMRRASGYLTVTTDSVTMTKKNDGVSHGGNNWI